MSIREEWSQLSLKEKIIATPLIPIVYIAGVLNGVYKGLKSSMKKKKGRRVR